MSKRQESHKDGKRLLRMTRNLGLKICDEGTYSQTNGSHHKIKFRYNGLLFNETIPLTSGSESMKSTYSKVRKSLISIGIDELPKTFYFRMVGSCEEREIEEAIEEMFELLDEP
jgi:hypothetical protein